FMILFERLLYLSYAHLFFILRPLLCFMCPKLKKRNLFEKKNTNDPACYSFSSQSQQAHVAFEVASEGELEQSFPVIHLFLSQGKRVELIYCSESVEDACQKLYQNYPLTLRLLRLPILRLSPYSPYQNPLRWLTAPVLIFCRYDFFPQLLLYKNKKGKRLFLISAVLKNKSLFMRYLLKKFDFIVAANQIQRDGIQQMLNLAPDKISFADFRLLQIAERHQNASLKFKNYSFMPELQQKLASYPKENRLILGNLWQEDLFLLEHPVLKEKIQKGEMQLTIIPHKLDPLNVELLIKKINAIFSVNVLRLKKDDEMVKDFSGILILDVKGLLCELYTLYGVAYVGGGFGVSVHSLLEPYLANCKTLCGPYIERSSEYDYIMSIETNNAPIVIQDSESFMQSLNNRTSFVFSGGKNSLQSVQEVLKQIEHKILKGDVCT
ncbi:MAG: hypothetical protein KBD63_07645, partial [Bacteriovoracaceae bacterium]|nr:hypothetical protein [Bacteriovoracaceae bacterium]